MATMKLNSITDHNFLWDPISAGTKFLNGTTITVGIGVINLSKPIETNFNKEQHAYRNCAICGKHYNYHKH